MRNEERLENAGRVFRKQETLNLKQNFDFDQKFLTSNQSFRKQLKVNKLWIIS